MSGTASYATAGPTRSPDLQVTQTVNGSKAIHCMIAKDRRARVTSYNLVVSGRQFVVPYRRISEKTQSFSAITSSLCGEGALVLGRTPANTMSAN